MASEISDKLFELARFCTKNQIGIEFTSYNDEKNVMEESIVNGKRLIRLEMGKPEDPNLLSEFTEFVKTIKESL